MIENSHSRLSIRKQVKLLGVSRNRLRRLMKIMGIAALVPKPCTSKPNKENHIYPYLLRNRAIKEVDEVWCADI